MTNTTTTLRAALDNSDATIMVDGKEYRPDQVEFTDAELNMAIPATYEYYGTDEEGFHGYLVQHDAGDFMILSAWEA